ncbi:MAG TPA: response regulator [Planctomycetota bacterium]|nr:response regulator [Planctomycetota bacterium]
MQVATTIPAKVLVVDDHEQNRYSLCKYLRNAGFDTVEAANGFEARALVALEPDIIILDVRLPDESGYDVCKWLKSNPPTASIPVMHLSATYVRGKDKVEGLDSGADAYLTYPIEPPELIATINALLRARRAEEEMRKANERLIEANRRKDEFLAMLAHELRNPLGPIRNSVEVLKRTETLTSTSQKSYEVIERQVAHMAHLIDDLLDVSRISSGKILLRKHKTDLCAVAKTVLDDYEVSLRKNDLKSTLVVPNHPVWVMADPTRIAQIIGNLLNNSVKFSDPGGKIEINISVHNNEVSLAVHDTGIGMTAETVQRLFDPFHQADSSLDRSKGGLGLGLALVKGIVDLHGGTVQASSPGPKAGSTVRFSLPMSPDQTAPEPETKTDREPALHHRILVIEDNLDAAESLQMLLTLDGYSVRIASSGQQGIDEARTFLPDVVICDIGLPGNLDGYAVAEALRRMPEFSNSLLIALTGYGQVKDLRRAKEAGFNVHLIKPVNPVELTNVISRKPKPEESL